MDYRGMSDNINIKECRICLESDDTEELFSPCKCKGSLKFVHRSCLESWRVSNNTTSLNRCELCNYEYRYITLVNNGFLRYKNYYPFKLLCYINILVILLDALFTRFDRNHVIAATIIDNIENYSQVNISCIYIFIYLLFILLLLKSYILISLLFFRHRRNYLKFIDINSISIYTIINYSLISICILYKQFLSCIILVDIYIYTILCVHINCLKLISNSFNNYIEEYNETDYIDSDNIDV